MYNETVILIYVCTIILFSLFIFLLNYVKHFEITYLKNIYVFLIDYLKLL